MKAEDHQDGMDAYKKGDYKTALEKWEPLALQGEAKAQFNLGLMYFYGQGVKQGYAKAVKWYMKAAEQGITKASLRLGQMYFDGNGVNQDIIQALKWFDIAGLNGDEEGREIGGALEKLMTRAQIAEARKLVGDGYFTNGTYWSHEELEEPREFIKKGDEIQSKTSENSSQSKGGLYTHSERGTKYCSNCAKEIYPYTSYVTEKYDGEKWQDIVSPEGEKIFCSSRCSREAWRENDGDDVNTPFGNYK